MADISKLKPGQVVYDVATQKMGNTSIRTVAVWSVRIHEVDADGRYVVASWNGNARSKFYGASICKWKLKPPILVRTGFSGQMRRATREEIAAMKADKT